MRFVFRLSTTVRKEGKHPHNFLPESKDPANPNIARVVQAYSFHDPVAPRRQPSAQPTIASYLVGFPY